MQILGSKFNMENAEKRQDISKPLENTFSLNSNPSTTLQDTPKKVADMNTILNYIKQNQPISCWKLTKALNIPNSSLYYKIRDLEFAGLIYSKIVINEMNRTERLLYSINKQESKTPEKEAEEFFKSINLEQTKND